MPIQVSDLGDSQRGLREVCRTLCPCLLILFGNEYCNKQAKPGTPWGRDDLESVAVGNRLMSRTLLLCALVEALGGVCLVEQPASSRIVWYPRFEWLVRKCHRMWMVGWWARHYGALTPKQHRAWSNSQGIAVLNRGKLTRQQRESCHVRTAVKKKKGNKTTYTGTKHLKMTQPMTQTQTRPILNINDRRKENQQK